MNKKTSCTMKFLFILIVLLVLISHNDFAVSQQNVLPEIAVSEGKCKPVLLDGIITPGEWGDALNVKIHERIDLLLKENSGHLFLGLKFKDAAGVIVDLWLTSDDKTVYQMHSSGRIGEAVLNLPVDEDTVTMTYGYTTNWDANEIRSYGRKKADWIAAGRPGGMDGYRKVLYPSDGKEFQIVLSKFSSNILKLRFKSGDPEGIIVYPDKSTLINTDNWLSLVLPEKYFLND